MKIYVLDTNVLISDTNCLTSFDDNEVVIPLAVIEELDKLKSRKDEVGESSREISRKLDHYRKEGKLFDGIKLESGGVIRVCSSPNIEEAQYASVPVEIKDGKIDNLIILTAYKLKSNAHENVIVVSNDTNVRIKCDALGIQSEEYRKIRVTDDKRGLYTGVKIVEVEEHVVDEIYNNGSIPRDTLPADTKFYPNEIVVIKSVEGDRTLKSVITRYTDERFKFTESVNNVYGLKPRNKEQNFAFDILLDPKISFVTLLGQAGCGKTLIALAAGLEQLAGLGDQKKQRYKKLIIAKPTQSVGADIGFLPGTIEEKLDPWMAPIRDNLNFLINNDCETSTKTKKRGSNKNSNETAVFENSYLNTMYERGIIEIQAISYIRGRSIPGSFVIIDEAQNLSMHELKTIVTRVGDGTKIVLTGDIEQIDNTHVDMYTNGLSYAIEKFKDYDIAGHVTLIKGERSQLATLASKILLLFT